MKYRLFLILVCFSLAIPAYAQEGGVATAELLPVPEGIDIADVLPAPDGVHIAYERRDATTSAVCRLNIVSTEETCVDLPFGIPGRLHPRISSYEAMVWSPDSTKLAIVGLPWVTFNDSDLLVVDLVAGTVTNLAEDNYNDILITSSAPSILVDIEAAWSPDGTHLAVERSVSNSEGHFSPSIISLIDVATGEARDLTLLPGSRPDGYDMGSVLAMDWSPDGSTLAMSIHHQELDPATDGIWLVDVASGETEQVLSFTEAETQLQSLYATRNELIVMSALDWSPDGTRLLLWIYHPLYVGILWPLWMDLDSRELRRLAINEPETLPDGIYPQAGWSPDGRGILVSIPYEDMDIRWFDLADGTSTSLGTLPLIATSLIYAIWGPDNDVIVDGHHMTITP